MTTEAAHHPLLSFSGRSWQLWFTYTDTSAGQKYGPIGIPGVFDDFEDDLAYAHRIAAILRRDVEEALAARGVPGSPAVVDGCRLHADEGFSADVQVPLAPG